MKVVELKTVEGKVRYYLADDMGAPVQPVLKYLKFKDNAGYARNTIRMHCIHLKHFFTYLGEAGKDYEKVNIDDIAGFLAWLKNPDILKKVIPFRFGPEHQPQTINAMVDTVVMFYDYLLRKKPVPGLYHGYSRFHETVGIHIPSVVIFPVTSFR